MATEQELQDEVERLRRELAETQARAVEAEHEALRERDKAMGMLARLGCAEWEAEQQRRRAEDFEDRLILMHHSLRYRVGTAVLAPGRALRGSRERRR